MYIAAGSLAIEYHNTPGVENFYQLTGVRDNTTVSLKPSQKFRKEETNFLTELSSLNVLTGACCRKGGWGWWMAGELHLCHQQSPVTKSSKNRKMRHHGYPRVFGGNTAGIPGVNDNRPKIWSVEFSVHNYNDDFSDGPPTVIWVL
jgi:hypothetical protein